MVVIYDGLGEASSAKRRFRSTASARKESKEAHQRLPGWSFHGGVSLSIRRGTRACPIYRSLTPRVVGCHSDGTSPAERWQTNHARARPYLLINHTSETWHPRPLPPRFGSAVQVSVNVPSRVAAAGRSNSSGVMSLGLSKGRMHLDRIVGLEADLDLKHVAGVNDPKPVRGVLVESVRTAARAAGRRSCPRGGTTTASMSAPDRKRSSGRGTRRGLCRTSSRGRDAADARVAQIVVKTARAGVGPVHDRVDLRQARRLGGELLDRVEPPLKARAGCSRPGRSCRAWRRGRRRSPCSGARSIACEYSEIMPRPARTPAHAGRRQPDA